MKIELKDYEKYLEELLEEFELTSSNVAQDNRVKKVLSL